jgi:hypothetical protein
MYKSSDLGSTPTGGTAANSTCRRSGSSPIPAPAPITTPLCCWAGWDYKEQALAIHGLIEERTVDDGRARDRVVPLLAGLVEVMPWMKQWHDGIDQAFGQCIADVLEDYLATQLNRYQLTADTLSTWAAPPVRRGRPPKRRLSSRVIKISRTGGQAGWEPTAETSGWA